MKINTLHIEKLQNKIFDLLMSNPDVGLEEMNDCRDAAKELVWEWIKESEPKPTKAVYELIEKIDLQGESVYYIIKNNSFIDGTFTRKLSEAEEMLQKFTSGKPSEPIINVLKTIEIDE